MKKIISAITVLCFLLNSVSLANTNLATPSPLDDIAAYHKYRVLAEMGFQLFLQRAVEAQPALFASGQINLDELKDMFRKVKGRDEYIYIEETHKHPAGVIPCFDEMDYVSIDNRRIIRIPIIVRNAEGKRQDYQILFSTIKGVPGAANMFPVRAYTNEELKSKKAEIIERTKQNELLPLAAEKTRAIENYKEQEAYDINVLKWAHDRGMAHEVSINEYIDDVLGIANIKVDDTGNPIKERKCYIISIDSDVILYSEMMKRLEKYKVTIIDKQGIEKKVIAFAHSSNKAIHLFILEDKTKIETIRKRLAHEIGVMTGCSVIAWAADGRPLNEMDLRYNEGLVDAVSSEQKAFQVVDLDILKGINANGEIYQRDYASGDRTIRPALISQEELLSCISVRETEDQMGEEAAKAILLDIRKAVEERGKAVMLFASAPSQHSTWKWLIHLWNRMPQKDREYLADKIIAFHMDEYLGLEANAPQLFGKVLGERLFGDLGIPKSQIFYFNDRLGYEIAVSLRRAIDRNDVVEIARLTKELEQNAQQHADEITQKFKAHGGVFDIVVGGIGKHPHVAFNDAPEAKFNDPKVIKVVRLSETSRQQQVDDGEFEKLSDVPTHALTFTLPPIFSARSIHIIVPREFKAESVRRTLDLDITEANPASGLRLPQNLPRVRFYLDKQAASKSKIAQIAYSITKSKEILTHIWHEEAVETLHPLYGNQLQKVGLYADSLRVLDEEKNSFIFIANNGEEDVVVAVCDESEIESVRKCLGDIETQRVQIGGKKQRQAMVFKFNPTVYRNTILRNPESNINDITLAMSALRYKIGRPATGLAITPATVNSIYAFLRKAETKRVPLSFIMSEPQIGVSNEPGYFTWNKENFVKVVDTLMAKMGITVPVTIERDHGKKAEDLASVLTHWNSVLMDYTGLNNDRDEAGEELNVDAIKKPADIYKFYEKNIMLLADKIQEAEEIQKKTGIQRGIEIGITEVGKKPTPASHVFWFLYYLYKELEKRGVQLRPSLSEAQIGTIHGYGAENLARRELLRDVAAMMGIFHLGEAAHGTSGTTKETLRLYPELGVAHAHIFTDFIVAEFRAMLEHNPELFIKYSREALIYEKTKNAFDKKVRPKYEKYNAKDLVVDWASYEEFVNSGGALQSVANLMEELDTLTPEQADRRRFADSNIAIMWFVLQQGRYLLGQPWALASMRELTTNTAFIESMERYVGAELDKFITLFNNEGIVDDMAKITERDLDRVKPITVGERQPRDLIDTRINELIEIAKSDNPAVSVLARRDLESLINIPFIQQNASKGILAKARNIQESLDADAYTLQLLEESRSEIPSAFYRNGLAWSLLTRLLNNLFHPERVSFDAKSGHIFSEGTTFGSENTDESLGLGIFLPKLVKSGRNVVVIVKNQKQREIVENLNRTELANYKEGKILCAKDVIGARTLLQQAGMRKCYYYWVKGDKETEIDINGITHIDITKLVKQIIAALGRVCGVVEELPKLYEAARKFAQAA